MSELDLNQLHNTEFPLPDELRGNVAVTSMGRLYNSSMSRIYNWGRRSSVWPLFFGLACCAIEMIATASSRYDFSRFGMEVMRASPRQADVIIISGTVTKKMVVPIVRLYNQMAEPKYILAMGACACGGGPFKEGYNVVSGIDKYIPVDVYVPGCPPTPQALLYGLISLQKKIDGQSISIKNDVPWYGNGASDPTPLPVLGPDIVDPRQMNLIRQQAERAASGEPFGVRELPSLELQSVEVVVAAESPSAEEEVDSEKAERLQKREAALARKRAREAAKKEAEGK